jgi:hypothetical protein
MNNLVKVICKERCNSISSHDPEWIIYDRGEIYEFYDDKTHYYQDIKCKSHSVNKKHFFTMAEWREKQINSILDD